MYVTRSYHIWKEVQLLPWLERNVQIVLDRVQAQDPLIKNMENLRVTLYSAKPPLNIHRHLLLSDMSDTIAPPAEVKIINVCCHICTNINLDIVMYLLELTYVRSNSHCIN
jgi:hypothetical protein